MKSTQPVTEDIITLTCKDVPTTALTINGSKLYANLHSNPILIKVPYMLGIDISYFYHKGKLLFLMSQALHSESNINVVFHCEVYPALSQTPMLTFYIWTMKINIFNVVQSLATPFPWD